jgi:hypothetical protein
MPGVSGVTVVTTLVCYLHTAHEAAGASGARHSLRPLISEGGTFGPKLARTRGEIAKPWLFENLNRRHNLVVIIRQRVGAARRPMTGSSG